MDDTIYFHLPSYTQHQKLNYLLAAAIHNDPDSFYPNIKIGSVYGTFTNAIWNGGRVIVYQTDPMEFIFNTYRLFNEIGIPLRHTFTNSALEETDVYDRYCNLIMEIGDNGLNEVLVNSPYLEKYIKEKYPNYQRISSTTKRLTTIESITEELDKDYKLVVLDYALNRDPRIFTLPKKEKLEILINAYCCDYCTRRKAHYQYMANQQKNFGLNRFMTEEDAKNDDGFACPYIADDFYTVLMNRQSVLRVEELYGFYYEMGFRNFKIEGRTNSVADVLESYVYYMVKPEFRDHVRLLLWRQYMSPIPMIQKPAPETKDGFVQIPKEEYEELLKGKKEYSPAIIGADGKIISG